MWGRLEHEIRLLPQVLACSISQDDVVVLLAPSADALEAESAILGILRRAGLPHGVRVLGGVAPLIERTTPPSPASRRSARVLVGTVAATGFLALSSLVGGLSVVDDGGAAQPPGERAARVPVSFEPDTPLRRIFTARIEGPSTEHVRLRGSSAAGVTQPISSVERADAPSRRRRSTDRTPTEPTTPSSPTVSSGCDRPRRDAARTRPGAAQGNGPRPWSWSVLIGPHDDCARGRPR